MNDDNEKEFIVWAAVMASCVAGIFVMLSFTISTDMKDFKKEAIKFNYAEYNSTNGVWQWKINAEKK